MPRYSLRKAVIAALEKEIDEYTQLLALCELARIRHTRRLRFDPDSVAAAVFGRGAARRCRIFRTLLLKSIEDLRYVLATRYVTARTPGRGLKARRELKFEEAFAENDRWFNQAVSHLLAN